MGPFIASQREAGGRCSEGGVSSPMVQRTPNFSSSPCVYVRGSRVRRDGWSLCLETMRKETEGGSQDPRRLGLQGGRGNFFLIETQGRAEPFSG